MNVQKIASQRSIGRRRFVELCAGSLALVTAGCGRRDRSRAKHSTITVLYPGDEWGMGPAWGADSKFLVFLPLVTRNAKGELESRLARSWEHSLDYRTWTFRLRTDVHWHDGVPVTAHDIKFTLDLFSHPAVLEERPGTYSVTVLDDSMYTIAYHQQAMGTPLDEWRVYYPKHLLERLDPKEYANWQFWTHPVGNGPYRYVRHVPKTMTELEANPDYFRGKPKIERVALKFSDNPSLTELLSGNVDVLPFVRRMDLLKLKSDPRFQAYYSIIGPDWINAIAWNQRHPPFGDPKVRRALTLAINRRELHQALNLPEQTPIFDVIFTEDQFRRAELPEPLPYDPELAKRLLEEAGWHDSDGDGVRDQGGKAFRFAALVTPLQGLDRGAVYIQAQLRRVGIQMDIQTLELEAAKQRLIAGEFDAAILFYTMREPYYGPLLYFGGTMSPDPAHPSVGSPIGYHNPRLIALLEEAEATVNPDEIDRIYRETWPIFQADLPMTFIQPAVGSTVAHRRVRGLSGPWCIDPTGCMEDLWLEDGSQQ